MYFQVADVDAVDENLSFLNVVIARYEVYECRLTAAALSYEGNRLALFDSEIYVLQHYRLIVCKRHIAELYAVAEASVGQEFWIWRVLYFYFGIENLVYALH